MSSSHQVAWRDEDSSGEREPTGVPEPGLLRALFLGRPKLRLLDAPARDLAAARPRIRDFLAALRAFMQAEVDPATDDERGEVPEEVLAGLRELGAFGMVVPEEDGGLGMTPDEYSRALMLAAWRDANVAMLLASHQSMGATRAVLRFGDEHQRRRFLGRCAGGALSAFAFTEPTSSWTATHAATVATLSENGASFVLSGGRLWCASGASPELIVVVARTGPGSLSAFLVEARAPGVELFHGRRLAGLRAFAANELALHDVRVPRENLLGGEGRGGALARDLLGSGRLAISAVSAGAARTALRSSRAWLADRTASEREPSDHGAGLSVLALIASTTLAMEGLTESAEQPGQTGLDAELTAVAVKEWVTARAVEVAHEAVELTRGAGIETDRSLVARGEGRLSLERLLRDVTASRALLRPSEGEPLFVGRAAVASVAAAVGADRRPAGWWARVAAGIRSIVLAAAWYFALWVPRTYAFSLGSFGALRSHVLFIERSSRRLARAMLRTTIFFRRSLDLRPGLLATLAQIGMALLAMAAAVRHGRTLLRAAGPRARNGYAEGVENAVDAFCRETRLHIDLAFRALFHLDDELVVKLGHHILENGGAWRDDELKSAVVPDGEAPTPVGAVPRSRPTRRQRSVRFIPALRRNRPSAG